MSPTNFSATAGLLALGLVVGPVASLMMAFAADPKTEPSSAAPAAFHAPSTPAPSAEQGWSVLLKTDGHVVQGKITKVESGYRLRTKHGEIPYGRREVEAVFHSMAEAYAYQNARTPSHDPDERMKLAQWCLTNGLTDEAKVELERVLELNPEHRRAKGMLFQIDAVASRTVKKDDAVIRSSVEMEQPNVRLADPDAPAPLDLNALREEYRRNPRGRGVPVIFDLSDAEAIRRFQQFAQTVHPILQKQCAGCHNERTPGSFPMLQAKSRKDLANDLIIRANLDATLRLVNPEDPAKSALLTSSLMPHAPKNQPIFLGPNQRSYREVADWVLGLKSVPEKSAPEVQSAANMSETASSGGGFAVSRRGASGSSPVAQSTQTPVPRLLSHPDPNVNRPDPDYPTDPLVGGPDAAKIKLRNRVKPRSDAADSPIAKDGKGAAVLKIGGEEIPIDTRADPKKTPKVEHATTKGAKRKLDPEALQRLMQMRNTPRS